MVGLRERQQDAVDMCRKEILGGCDRIMLAAPCSFGKTRVAAHMLMKAANNGVRGLFLCDRIKLINQAIDEFDSHGIDIGVMQGIHDRYDPWAWTQIASVATLARRKIFPHAGLIIIDEAHTHYQYITKMMQHYDCPFIGLSATPYAKGLGRYYKKLIVPATAQELMDEGLLCPVKYYAGPGIDTSQAPTKQIPTGGSDFDPAWLETEAEEKKHQLTGDIIENWYKRAEGMMSIAFSPSIKQSKWMCNQFKLSGVEAYHIDGYMELEERDELYQAHRNGDFLILSCSKLLNTGYDEQAVQCLIDAYPTKSIIQYVQRGGRIMRTHPSKEYSVYLDHAGNIERFMKYGGFPERITPISMHDGTRNYNQSDLAKKEEFEPQLSSCPDCCGQIVGIRCECGYEKPRMEILRQTKESLEEVVLPKRACEKRFVLDSTEQKSNILGQLSFYAQQKKKPQKWIGVKFKQYYGEAPNGVVPSSVNGVSAEMFKWIQGMNIRSRHRRR